jgi:hypothetical protein
MPDPGDARTAGDLLGFAAVISEACDRAERGGLSGVAWRPARFRADDRYW